MKALLIVACLCLLFVACACSVSGKGPNELHIGVVLTTGEHSKDSGSNTTSISIELDTIVWQKTSSRDRRTGTPPLRKEFKLSPADKESLRSLIRSKNLLLTDVIEIPPVGSNYRYFKISVDLNLDEKIGTISISGPRSAVQVKDEKLYQNTLILIKELFRIMNTQDRSVRFEELILEPKGEGQ